MRIGTRRRLRHGQRIALWIAGAIMEAGIRASPRSGRGHRNIMRLGYRHLVDMAVQHTCRKLQAVAGAGSSAWDISYNNGVLVACRRADSKALRASAQAGIGCVVGGYVGGIECSRVSNFKDVYAVARSKNRSYTRG